MAAKQKPDAPKHPELSATEVQERLWSEPGGDEDALREAKTGNNDDNIDESDLVAEETPGDTIERISDPRISRSVLGPDEKVGSENAGKNKGLGNEGRFSEKGDGERK